MRGLIGQFLLPPLLVVLSVIAGSLFGVPGVGLLAGLLLGFATAGLLAWHAQRRLRRISQIASRARAGSVVPGHPPAVSDEIDRALYDSWRLANEAVRRQEADADRITQLGLLLDRMQDGVMRVAPDGTVTFANVTAAAMFGGSNPIGRSLIRVTRDHELERTFRACLSVGTDQQLTFEVPAGQRMISASIALLREDSQAALITFRDITEVDRLQHLRRDFVANVSHELRTPLATIKILTETLLDLREDDEEAAGFLRKIDLEVDTMSALVRDLLDLARLETRGALTIEPLAVTRLIEDVRDRMLSQAQRRQVELRLVPPSAPTTIDGDERRLHQALINLVQNAIAHTPAGGAVTIRAESSGGEIALSVTDTGGGIAPEDLSRIWERFYKADHSRTGEGTGLGLAIVKHIVQAHQGTVDVASAPGKGSVFTIRLPR